MDELVNLGVVGLGRGFMLTAPALRAHPGVRLRGAFDPRPEATARFAAEFAATAHGALDALLDDPAIDAVYIATPHALHADQAIRALRAGKHVLVEKPMAVSVEDAVAMARAADAAGRALVVGPSHGFDEPVRRAAALVAGGRFGPARMVTAFNFTDFMYRPRRPEEMDPTRGGGVVYSQAAHQVDMVRRLVGQPVATVRAVTGAWDAERPGDGAYQALMTFAGGAVASLTYSGYGHYDSDALMGWISELGQKRQGGDPGAARRTLAAASPADEARAKLARTYGVAADPPPPAPHHEHFGFVLVSCERADLKLGPTGIELFGEDGHETVPIAPPALPRAAVIDEFVAAALGRAAAVHDGAWGVQTMACCAAIVASGATGREIEIGRIVGQAQGDITA